MGMLAFAIWATVAALLFPVWSPRDGGPARAAALGLLLLGLSAATALTIADANQSAPDQASSTAESQAQITSSSPARDGSESPQDLPMVGWTGYEVVVEEGAHQIFRVDAAGAVTSQRTATFSRRSMAPVDRVVAPGGLVHWRTIAGYYTGWSYIPNRSGPFSARAVFTDGDGALRYVELGETGE